MPDVRTVDGVDMIPVEDLPEWGDVLAPPKQRSDGRLVRAHKVRLYPTPRQETYFIKCVEASNYSFNRSLDLWQRMYKETGKASAYSVRKQLIAEKDERAPWLREVSHCVVKNAAADVGDAFERFFEGQNGYPKFKRKSGKGKSSKRSFKADNGPGTVHVRDRGNPERPGLHIPLPSHMKRAEFGLIKMAEQLRWEDGEVRGVTISQDAAGRWFGAFTLLTADDTPTAHKSKEIGGADVGSRNLVAEPDGTLHENPKALEAMQKKRARLQRELQRRTPGSRGWQETKKKLARLETKAADLREDATHKATNKVTNKYGVLGVETLNVAGMMKNKKVARTLQDANLGETRRQLIYKTHHKKGTVVAADRWFPSSKRCSACEVINHDLEDEEHWTCPSCGAEHNRDTNASENLTEVAEGVMQVGRVPPELTLMESTALPGGTTPRTQPDFDEIRTRVEGRL